MPNTLGYDQPLFILAFDQRASILEKLLQLSPGQTPSPEVADQMERFKTAIYEGFRYALAHGVPQAEAAILVDEQYGHAILHDAVFHGFTVALTTEKTGQHEFDFEYGDEFTSHLLKYRPTFAKVLVRHNPEAGDALNVHEHAKLVRLREFCDRENFKLLVELILPPTDAQLAWVGNDLARYDREIRPALEIKLVKQFQNAGIEADVWKIEGLTSAEQYRALVGQVQSGGRDKVGVAVLGRAASDEQVEEWLRVGAGVDGVIGFAVGRTIFWEPIARYHQGSQTWEQTVEQIGEHYLHFYRVFSNIKSKKS
ncbi:MAG: DUF2090 domain-containing protein [Candidatus Liptonbacteria bacterium]|nr:DUF2090 domain-containing protein [Candidatus Liptonbacteria bacterium]